MKEFLSNFFQWVKRDREPAAKKRTYLESQDVAQFGAMNLWEDSVHHEIIARFIIFHMSASQNQIFCIFLHTVTFEVMHTHKLAQKLHFFRHLERFAKSRVR